VFANKRKIQEHNWEHLKAEHSIDNPIARMRVKGKSKGKEIRNLPKCFKQDSDIESVLNMCREAKVQLMGNNF
jgi:allantoicase